jgi:sigma-B regulation protein RsbU (phosphoserine phosphatase)
METLTVAATLDCLKSLRAYVQAAAAGLDEKAGYRLRLAVDEIATNVIVHGYPQAGREGVLKIRAEGDEESLRIILEDTGAPYDPRQTRPPTDLDLPLEERRGGGLGVYLALRGVDEFIYERVGDWNRNIFVAYRRGASAAGRKAGKSDAVDERGRLLIVEKNEANRGILSGHLQQRGHTITVVDDGRQALDLLKTREFDLVLVNAGSPETGADQVLAHLNAESSLRRIPVIVVGGADDAGTIERWIQSGAADYFLEPPIPALLHARVSRYLERKKGQEELLACTQELHNARKLRNDLILRILPIGIALSAEKDFDQLLGRILREAKSICNADGGTLYLRAGDCLEFAIMLNDSLRLAVSATPDVKIPFPPLRLYDETTAAPNTQNVATAAAVLGRSINIPDIYDAKDFDFAGTKLFDERNGYRSVSVLTVPLKNYDREVIGVLQLLNALDPRTAAVIPFDLYMQQVVEALASQAAVVLNSRMLIERQRQLLRYEQELEIGRQIQASFLPEKLPQVAGWEIAARFHPAREVAGDFYDAFYLENSEKVGVVIADVTDKGVGAALFMALFRTLIRAFGKYSTDGRAVGKSAFERTNDYVLQNHLQANMFATIFFGVLDPATGVMAYVNGGHNPPGIIGSRGVKGFLKPTGPAVGMLSHVKFEVEEVSLEPGDILLAFTDGVTEARDPSGRFFGEKRLRQLLEQPASSAAALLDRIEEGVHAHAATASQSDDVTMIAVRRVS